jgi:CheY-like chemotaxis protein
MTAPAPCEPAPRILLVEDSWENVAYVTALLEELDCVVDTATNGRQAMGLFESGRYAVVLMDCQMPVMDGFEPALTWINANTRAACQIDSASNTAAARAPEVLWPVHRRFGLPTR